MGYFKRRAACCFGILVSFPLFRLKLLWSDIVLPDSECSFPSEAGFDSSPILVSSYTGSGCPLRIRRVFILLFFTCYALYPAPSPEG